MKGKKIKRLFNLIALSFITVSLSLCGCKFALFSENAETEPIQQATLPEVFAHDPQSAPEAQAPALSSPEPVTPPANSQAVASTQAEVAAEFEFTPISDAECSVICTNILEVTYAEVPRTAIIDGKEYTVTEIAPKAFNRYQDGRFYNTDLKTVKLPTSVTKIGAEAFMGCGNLADINLAWVEEIESEAFNQCYSLTAVKLNCVTKIDYAAFIFCENLETVYMLEITEIGTYAFRGCLKLSEIVIPKTVETMGWNVFAENNTNVKVLKGTNTDNWDNYWNEGNSGEVEYDYIITAQLEFTPISETECFVKCTNSSLAMYAEIPSTATIDGKEYTVTEIAGYGFYDCEELEYVQLPATVKKIGSAGFGWCKLLSEIDLSAVEIICENAFGRNGNLAYADLSSVKEIGPNAFMWCTSITEAVMPDLTKIERGTFGRCESLSKVYIPNVKEIDRLAFDYCFALNEIIIPDTVEIMGRNIFSYCNTQVKAVAQEKPEGWAEDWNYGNENQNVIWGYRVPAELEFTPVSKTECSVSCTNKELAIYAEIPSSATIDGREYTVTEIAESGFENCLKLESVALPDSVKIIAKHGFMQCENLSVINLSAVTEIGEGAFFCCNLTGAIMPEVVKIDNGAFAYCRVLEEVYMPKVKEIGTVAFAACPSLGEIVIPDTVEVTGENIFQSDDTQVKAVAEEKPEGWDDGWNTLNKNKNVIWGWFEGKAVFGYTPIEGTENCSVYCINKDEVTYAEVPQTAIINNKVYTVTDISSAFSGCEKLETAILPDSVTKIGNYTFYKCINLREIVSSNITEIGNSAFAYCSLVDELIISGVTKIGSSAFRGCENLTRVEINYVTEIGTKVFEDCTNLISAELNYVSIIGSSAFIGCKSLSEVNLNGVTEIGSAAFVRTGLKSIVIPATVEKMGINVFAYCDAQIKAVAQEKPEGWRESWNANNANQNVIWGWSEGNAVFGYTPIEGTENCSVYCINKEEVTCAEIPSTAIIDGKEYTVTQMADHIFASCDSLKTVIIPDSITEIPAYGFYCCHYLETLVLPGGLTAIGDMAFNDCFRLKTTCLQLPNVTKIGRSAFNLCRSIEVVEIPKAESIGYYAFGSCKNLKEIVIPECVKAMGAYVFEGCNTRIYAVAEEKPEGWHEDWNKSNYNQNVIWGWKDSLGRFAYNVINDTECEISLINKITAAEAYIPAKVTIAGKDYTVTQIAEGGFANCAYLNKVVLPNTIKRIEDRAFSGCTALEMIVLPKSVEYVGDSVFYGNVTHVYARGMSPSGWYGGWNTGNGCIEAEFYSNYILPWYIN